MKYVLFLLGNKNGPSSNFRYVQLKELMGVYNIKTFSVLIKPQRRTSSNYFFFRIILSLFRIINAVLLLPILPFFDAVVSIRDIVPNNKIQFIEKLYFLFSRQFITDFDDSFFLNDKKKKAIHTICNSSKVVVGNSHLASFVRIYNPNVFIIPTVVDTNIFKPENDFLNKKDISQLPIIVWTGSKGTRELHLPLIYPVLNMLAERIKFKLRVIADKNPFENLNMNYETEFIYWDSCNPTRGLYDSTLGIMPLVKDEFELGKCGFKLIQYGAVGIPSVATNWGVNSEIIVHGFNGFLCDTDEDWLINISTLIQDSSLRSEMGNNARKNIVKHYSLETAVKKWVEVL